MDMYQLLFVFFTSADWLLCKPMFCYHLDFSWMYYTERCRIADASIRKRALELVFLLVNYTNVKPLTKELVDCLVVTDPDFKEDLAAKIYSTVEKFSQEKLWYLDHMFKVLSLPFVGSNNGSFQKFFPGGRHQVASLPSVQPDRQISKRFRRWWMIYCRSRVDTSIYNTFRDKLGKYNKCIPNVAVSIGGRRLVPVGLGDDDQCIEDDFTA